MDNKNNKKRPYQTTPLKKRLLDSVVNVVCQADLTDQERSVMNMILDNLSSTEISIAAGVSSVRVRQITNGAIVKIADRKARAALIEENKTLKNELKAAKKLLSEKEKELARLERYDYNQRHDSLKRENYRLNKELLQLKEILQTKEDGSKKPHADMPAELSAKRLDDFNLSVHTTNFLNKNDIVTIDDLLGRELSELASIRGCGKKTIKELVTLVKNLGVVWC
jgi:DNA-directed RNA polymerase alpha subunit